MSRDTTIWGVVIAAGIIGATLALNAPGGSNSIAGRAITWTMTRLFPPEPRPTAAPPAFASTRPASPPAPPVSAPAAPPTKAQTSEAATRRSAVRARAYMSHAPAGIEFRNVYAITTLGLFNAEAQDKAFLGFCGELKVPEGAGWGRPGWKPFFISETASLPIRGQGPYLDMANTSTLAKCANVKPSRDYSDVFRSGATDVAPAYMLTPRRAS